MKQTVAHKKLTAWQGVLLILALLAVILALDFAIECIGSRIGAGAASACFWVCGVLIALWIYRTYIVVIQYELESDVLRLSRRYGKRERPIESIYLRTLLFVGAPEEAKRRYPQAKKISALHSRSRIPVSAVVYRDSVGVRMALLQLNDELKAALTARLKQNRP